MKMDFHSPTSQTLPFLYQKTKLHWSDLVSSLAKCVDFSWHQKDFFVVESWWIWMICVGKNCRVSEESQRTLHVAPVRKQSNVLFSHLGSLRLWQDRFAWRHPFFCCLLHYPGRRSLLQLWGSFFPVTKIEVWGLLWGTVLEHTRPRLVAGMWNEKCARIQRTNYSFLSFSLLLIQGCFSFLSPSVSGTPGEDNFLCKFTWWDCRNLVYIDDWL